MTKHVPTGFYRAVCVTMAVTACRMSAPSRSPHEIRGNPADASEERHVSIKQRCEQLLSLQERASRLALAEDANERVDDEPLVADDGTLNARILEAAAPESPPRRIPFSDLTAPEIWRCMSTASGAWKIVAERIGLDENAYSAAVRVIHIQSDGTMSSVQLNRDPWAGITLQAGYVVWVCKLEPTDDALDLTLCTDGHGFEAATGERFRFRLNQGRVFQGALPADVDE